MFLSFTLCALTLIQSPLALADKEDLGRLLGIVLGAAAGNKAGNGNVGATIAGAIVGGVVLGAIGRELDENDRNEMLRARGDCLERNEQTEWRGNGGNGSIVILQEGYHVRSSSMICRSYENTIYRHGRRETTRGYACRDNYGRWNEVSETEITYARHEHRRRDEQTDMPDYNRPGQLPVHNGMTLGCVMNNGRFASLIDVRNNMHFANYSDYQACQFALSNQRGAMICIESQNLQSFAIDVRTRQSVGYMYRNLLECVRNLR